MANRKIVVLLSLLILTACGPRPWAQGINMSHVPPDETQAALAVRVFDQTLPPPTPSKIIGEVRATSCKNKLWDAPATRGDALAQLRLKALRMGGNAVVAVTYDERGKDALGTNCWESVTATGTAVVL